MLDQLPDQASIRAAFSWIDTQRAPLIETVRDWSAINSGSRNLDGLRAMEKAVLAFAEPLGADVEIIDLPDGEELRDDGTLMPRKNGRAIRLARRGHVNRRVLLTGHTDTVFPKDSPFQKAVWLDDETLNGPGVADMKGGILVMLTALMALERTPLAERIGWEVILSPDEETGSHATAPILMEHARKADIGLTYEPCLPDGTLAGERKGSGNFSLLVKGVSAHAGREFFKGRNAVVKLSEIVGELAALTGGRKDLTLNPAVVTGGVAPNVVPDTAVCRFNVRLSTAADGDWVLDRLNEIVARHDAAEGFTVSLHGGINRPPKEISPANRRLMDAIRDCGAALGIAIDYVPTGGCCEGNNLAAAGLPNVDTLGVLGGQIHSAGEYLKVDSLTERSKLSTLILAAFAAGLIDPAETGVA
ncbi:hydrolase [Yunchengibacter salinarum]|uniref:hydrolase n=1 Tax=Yunchengibacter salinarum TaxID=3133399 RepID=UPI0035B583E5